MKGRYSVEQIVTALKQVELGDVAVYASVSKPGYKFRRLSLTLTNPGFNVPVFQIDDANGYSNP